jgi:hypothetical protein
MKKLILFALLCSVPAFGQAYSSTALQNSPGNYSRAVPYAQITLCVSTDTAVPCTQKAVTFVDDSLTTQCGQKTASGVLTGNPAWGANCNNPGLADAVGNFTIYATAGNYRLCVYAQLWACQEISIGGGGGGASVNCSVAVNGSLAAFTSPTILSCDHNAITDFAGNLTAQSYSAVGPVNGFLSLIGGGVDPGTQVKFKLPLNTVRFLAPLTVGTSFYLVPPPTTGLAGQLIAELGQTTDGNGDIRVATQWQDPVTPGSGGANKTAFDQCSPGESSNAGNSFWSVVGFTNWDAGHWEFVLNTNADIYCSIRVPSNLTATPAQIIIDLASADNVAGHTATFETCDALTTTRNPQVGSLTCAATQNYSSTTTAYAVTELAFNVQSSPTVDQILVVQIHQASGGANSANIFMYPPKLKVQ